jgi:hypothetical protein
MGIVEIDGIDGMVGELLDRFCGEARIWGEQVRAGRLDAVDRMSPLWDRLIELGAGAEIAALVDHPAAAVRYCAAARLHRHDWRRARAVMEPLAAEPPPLGVFAGRLLERWARGDVEWRRVTLRFRGTVTASDYLGRWVGPLVVTDIDPRFSVSVDVDQPPVEGPFGAGAATFAVHSLAHSFAGNSENVGVRMRFELEGRERGREWRMSGLRGRPTD